MSQRMRGPPPPFIDTRRGGVHVREISGVVVFSPNRGRTVSSCCRKYTVEHWRVWRWAWQLSWETPWPCGDRACVLMTPVGVVVVAVEGTVLCARASGAPRVLLAGSCSGQGPYRIRGSRPCQSWVLWRRKVRGVSSIVAGTVSGLSAQGVAGSHRVGTVPGMAAQRPELADGTLVTPAVWHGGLMPSDSRVLRWSSWNLMCLSVGWVSR